MLASEEDVLAALEALPPPDHKPPPAVTYQMVGGLSSLVEQLRPLRQKTLTDLPEELLLYIVESAFVASIASAGQVERLAPLAATCCVLRFIGSERCAEHLARALYPAASLHVYIAPARVSCAGLSSLVKQLRHAKAKGGETAATAALTAPPYIRESRHVYSSWRKCLSHDNAFGGVWCVEVDNLVCRAHSADGASYCEARASQKPHAVPLCPMHSPINALTHPCWTSMPHMCARTRVPESTPGLINACAACVPQARIQAMALDLHDDVAEVVLLIDAAGDASALAARML